MRLTEELRERMRSDYAVKNPARRVHTAAVSQHELARRYGVSQTTVYRVVNGLKGKGRVGSGGRPLR